MNDAGSEDRAGPEDRANSTAEVLRTIAAHWDSRAATFDEEPDHGLIDPVVRAAWARHLTSWLPRSPARVADLGCGTGTLAVLSAGMGYEVTASDLSPGMVARARRKAESAGVSIEVAVGDAAAPDLPDRSVDAVLVRHLVWTLPDPVSAIDRWVALLRPGGRLVVVEGRWHLSVRDDHGARGNADEPTLHRKPPWYGGVAADTLIPVLERRFDRVIHYDLGGEVDLWGRVVSDERFAAVAYRTRGLPVGQDVSPVRV